MQISRLMTLRTFNFDKDDINQRVRSIAIANKTEAGRAFHLWLSWAP